MYIRQVSIAWQNLRTELNSATEQRAIHNPDRGVGELLRKT